MSSRRRATLRSVGAALAVKRKRLYVWDKMSRRRLTVIGFLGSTLDQGKRGPARWESWRPTVSLCQHDDLLVDRLVLMHGVPVRRAWHKAIAADMAQVSPETAVQLEVMEIADPWDLEETYGALRDFARRYPFDPTREDYLAHITTGTHIAQISMFLLVESRHIPGTPDSDLAAASTRTATRRARTRSSTSISRGTTASPAAFRRSGPRACRSSRPASKPRTRPTTVSSSASRQVAIASRDPVLLCGPTGSGKSQLARRIYELKKTRRQVGGELVEVNCATLRGDAAMSTLFGHVRGAYTGAAEARGGMLRKADKGVLFLDEIGELGLDEQAMLLRAIEDKIFFPVGADKEVHSDFQLIAGTNRDLTVRVASGRFREDLLARINLWTFFAARPARTPGRHRAKPRVRARTRRRRPEATPHDEPGSAGALPRLRPLGGRPLERQLPRLRRVAAPHGDALRRWADQRRRGRRRARAPARPLARRAGCREGNTRIATAPSIGCSTEHAFPRSIASTASSSKRSSASAGPRDRSRRRAASFSPRRGPRAPPRTTPIACGSTSPGTVSRCKRFSRLAEHLGVRPQTSRPRRGAAGRPRAGGARGVAPRRSGRRDRCRGSSLGGSRSRRRGCRAPRRDGPARNP